MTISSLLPYVSAGCASLLGLGILLRTPRTIASWMFATGMVLLSLEALYNGAILEPGNSTRDVEHLHEGRLTVLSFLPGAWLLFSMTYARGNAAETIRKWRVPLGLIFLAPITICFLLRTSLVYAPPSDASLSEIILRLGVGGSMISVFLLGTSVAVLMNLERTFRASVGTMRWRIKFMVLGIGLLFVVRLYTSSQSLLFGAADPTLESLNSAALIVAAILVSQSLLRAGRFALDVYPSQTVLQSSLTILLAGIYLLVVGLFAKIVAYFGGDTSFALKTFVVLVSLVLGAILLQSDRARLILRRFVSRNFQRPVYDYRTVWRKFTEGTASRVEQTDLCRTLVRLMAEMFQALSVSIWLLDSKKQSFVLGGSTSLLDVKVREEGPQLSETSVLSAYFELNHDPVDIEQIDQPWATVLRRWQPSEFSNGGHRVCLPLIGRGELLGLITLGDRVAGAPFSIQDLDMLKCAGDHAAANLYNVQLSHKLVEAKQLEAFQTMATFFVHDLKNAASTLKLMLQNLPIHFDDPEFRADALRGTAKTVNHIDHLIGRLGSLRHELKVQPALTDLNEVVDQAIGGLEQGQGVRLVKIQPTLPRIQLDREQIGKVITNLVLNAVEASPKHSPIHITTNVLSGWAIISVADKGCGMSADFIGNSLFKPFQTTKKGGLGIGMFQSKLIVEAHAGKISVLSQPGQGTTFEIALPLPK